MNSLCVAGLIILILPNCHATLLVQSLQDEVQCGVSIVPSNKIVGGETASPGEWPWQALFVVIASDGRRLASCGGTLINEKWVVTAAHCTESLKPENIHIYLGEHDYSKPSNQRKAYAISSIINHPDYTDEPVPQNDVSLLQLAGEVNFTDYIRPACLPKPNENVTTGEYCWITGWGRTNNDNETQNILREAKVPIVSISQCEEWYKTTLYSSDYHLCAGYEEGGTSVCNGDSGGPLVCQQSNSSFVLQGITSFGGALCAEPRKPGVFARASKYTSWIEKIISSKPENEDFFFSIPATSCGANITTNRRIRLPFNPETQLYHPNMDCKWTIQPESRKYTHISFTGRFSVERSFGSCQDYVEIVSHADIERLCGYSLPTRIVIENKFDSLSGASSEITIRFKSDESFELEGFAMDVKFTDDIELGQCGLSVAPKSKIVGGETATPGEWPWQALFAVTLSDGRRSASCGGTLINEKWVVTAAHCTESKKREDIRIILGETDFVERSEQSKEFAVAKIFDHPGYTERPVYKNDISLLKLIGEVTYTDFIIPVCLPTQNQDVTVGLECWITGWGETENNNEPRNILREAKVPILSTSQCDEWYDDANVQISPEYHLCAGYERGGTDTCQGDSGGPLVCQSNITSPFILEGVTSFGVGCADYQKPGVYARVSEYVSWIEQTMRDNSKNDDFFSIPATQCGARISSNSSLRLPFNSETHLYHPNMECVWTLNPGNYEYTRISFIGRFSVQKIGDECIDYVEIANQQGVLKRHCGYTLPENLSIENKMDNLNEESSEIEIRFKSNLAVEYEGFAIDIIFHNSALILASSTFYLIGTLLITGLLIVS